MWKWFTSWWRRTSQTASPKNEGSSISGDDQSLSSHSEGSSERGNSDSEADAGQASSAQLPAIIDPNKAITSFLHNREDLRRILCAELLRVTGELYAKGIISTETHTKASHLMYTPDERSMILLNAVESKMRVESSIFTEFVHILESEPYTNFLANALVQSYNICTTPLEIISTSIAISRYADYLREVYENTLVCDDRKFPPTPSTKYVNLTKVCMQQYHERREVMKYALHGDIEQVLEGRKKVNIGDILVPVTLSSQRLRLVLIEGPPGVGKSTLAWELCRRWDKISHMREYNLVVLLRLREKSVQQVKAVADLFYHVDSDLQQSVAKEVVSTEGKGVLFILDGFDELSSNLRYNGLLIDLIKGNALPKSTVIITSRSSATADLLRTCRSQVQKHVEILGFTQECVKEYASSVFSSEPKLLDDFLTYILASRNPVINSLMCIPLNAAIVVELYRNSRRIGGPIPKTLTQLYTQLCLTLIQRYLDNEEPSDAILNSFADLTEKDHSYLLNLSEIAFQGFKKDEVVFDSLPRKIVHFGFLDVVPSFLGGDSHNFLHFTLQEFLVAYHISQLSHHEGLEVFKQYGSDKRWNMVWRFVAGLTGFEFFKASAINSEAFATTKENRPQLSCLLIQCLYEAQITEFDYAAAFGSKEVIARCIKTPLDKYALGFCIANSAPTTSWDVELKYTSTDSFIWGLRSTKECKGTITTIRLNDCLLKAGFKDCPTSILDSINSLTVYGRYISQGTMSHLAGLISSLCNLDALSVELVLPKLGIAEAELLKVVYQLQHPLCKVSRLCISGLNYRAFNLDYCVTALSKLIDPSSGKLKTLSIHQNHIDTNRCTPKALCTLLFNSSSLQELRIYLKNPCLLSLLESNTRLICFHFECEWTKEHAESIAHVLQKNTTLQHLSLGVFHKKQMDLLVVVTNEMKKNTVLKKLELVFYEDIEPNEYPKFNSDSRTYITLSTKSRSFIGDNQL